MGVAQTTAWALSRLVRRTCRSYRRLSRYGQTASASLKPIQAKIGCKSPFAFQSLSTTSREMVPTQPFILETLRPLMWARELILKSEQTARLRQSKAAMVAGLSLIDVALARPTWRSTTATTFATHLLRM